MSLEFAASVWGAGYADVIAQMVETEAARSDTLRSFAVQLRRLIHGQTYCFVGGIEFAENEFDNNDCGLVSLRFR